MRAGLLGQIVTPAAGNRLLLGVDWCADNAVFANRYPGDDTYLAWLDSRRGLPTDALSRSRPTWSATQRPP